MYAFIRKEHGIAVYFFVSQRKFCYAVNKEKGGDSKIIFFNIQFVKKLWSPKWDIDFCIITS